MGKLSPDPIPRPFAVMAGELVPDRNPLSILANRRLQEKPEESPGRLIKFRPSLL